MPLGLPKCRRKSQALRPRKVFPAIPTTSPVLKTAPHPADGVFTDDEFGIRSGPSDRQEQSYRHTADNKARCPGQATGIRVRMSGPRWPPSGEYAAIRARACGAFCPTCLEPMKARLLPFLAFMRLARAAIGSRPIRHRNLSRLGPVTLTQARLVAQQLTCEGEEQFVVKSSLRRRDSAWDSQRHG